MSKDRYENTRYARFALQAMRRRVRRFERCTRKLRRNKARGIELVHQARVSARELRSAMAIFKSLLPTGKTKPWRHAARDVARSLGEVRDRDVQLVWLDELLSKTDDRRLKPGIERVRLRIAQSQRPHRDAAAVALRKLKKTDACAQMQTWLESQQAQVDNRIIQAAIQRAASSPVEAVQSDEGHLVIRRAAERGGTSLTDSDRAAASPGAATGKAINALMPVSEDELTQLRDKTSQIIVHQFDELMRYADCVDQPEQVARLHEMRIVAKHLRYTLEMFAPIVEGGLSDVIELTRQMQQLLGDVHDCDVWAEFLKQFTKVEYQRHVDFHGHAKAFGRLKPGIEHVAATRQSQREATYNAFRELWQTRTTADGWQHVRETLEALRIRPRHRHLFSA